jgi:ubiquinone biosynthesis UbiH/UbiF/VisC/COQ6 family hydroxylase
VEKKRAWNCNTNFVMHKKVLSSVLRRYSTQQAKKHYDVVIVGGGMVGGTLANCLLKSKLTNGLKIAIVDKNNTNLHTALDKPPVPGIRVSALSPKSIDLFEKLDVFPLLRRRQFDTPPEKSDWFCAPFKDMQVWDETNHGSIKFNANELGKGDKLGCVIDNDILVSGLMQNLESHKTRGDLDYYDSEVSNVQFPQYQYYNEKNYQEDRAVITLTDKMKISASLLIGCDGVNSTIRTMATIPLISWNYRQRALVATLRTTIPHFTAYQRFLNTGPIALLPCTPSGDCSNIVWSTTPEHAAYLMGLEAQDLVNEINKAFHHEPSSVGLPEFIDRFVPKGTIPSPPTVTEIVQQEKKPWRGAFPLRRLHATEYVRPRLALAGDAAHGVHPLAGQGVNLGIADTIVLTKALQLCIESGADIGDVIMLRQNYANTQFRRNEIAIDQLEVIKRMFDITSSVPVLPVIRALGMSTLDKLSFIKTHLVEMASGYDVDISHIGSCKSNYGVDPIIMAATMKP